MLSHLKKSVVILIWLVEGALLKSPFIHLIGISPAPKLARASKNAILDEWDPSTSISMWWFEVIRCSVVNYRGQDGGRVGSQSIGINNVQRLIQRPRHRGERNVLKNEILNRFWEIFKTPRKYKKKIESPKREWICLHHEPWLDWSLQRPRTLVCLRFSNKKAEILNCIFKKKKIRNWTVSQD